MPSFASAARLLLRCFPRLAGPPSSRAPPSAPLEEQERAALLPRPARPGTTRMPRAQPRITRLGLRTPSALARAWMRTRLRATRSRAGRGPGPGTGMLARGAALGWQAGTLGSPPVAPELGTLGLARGPAPCSPYEACPVPFLPPPLWSPCPPFFSPHHAIAVGITVVVTCLLSPSQPLSPLRSSRTH